MNPLNSHTVDMDATSEATAGQGSVAQAEVLLKYALGVDMPANLRDDTERQNFSARVAANVCRTMAASRNALTDVAKLTKSLDANITKALNRVSSSQTNVNKNKTMAALIDAIYESVGMNVMRDLVAEKMVPFNGTEQDKPMTLKKSRLILPGLIGPHDVEINLSHPFWANNSKISSAADLQTLMDKKKIKDLGITIYLSGTTTKISDNTILDAAAIVLITAGAQKDWDVVKLGNDFGMSNGTETIDSKPVEWSIDIDYLVRQRTGVDAPAALRGRTIGSFELGELEDLLKVDAYWKKFMPSLAEEFDSTDTNAAGVEFARVVALKVWADAGRSAVQRLAQDTMELHDLQKEISLQKEIQTKLTSGSQNPRGAQMAMLMIMKDPSLKDVVQGANESAILKDIEKMNWKKSIHNTIEELRKLPAFSLKQYETKVPGVMSKISYTDLKKEYSDLNKELAAFKAGNDAYIIDSRYATSHSLSIDKDPKKNKDEIKEINSKLQEINNDIAKFIKLEQSLQNLYEYCKKAGYTGIDAIEPFKTYFVSGVVNPAAIDSEINMHLIADEAFNALKVHAADPLITASELDEQIKAKSEEFKNAKKSTLTGDALQQKVFAAYLEKHQGLSDAEAKNVGNYLTAQTFLDQVAVDQMLSSMFENKEKSSDEDTDKKIINQVAFQCGIDSMYSNTWTTRWNLQNIDLPNWSRASYPQLCRAYFSLRELRNKTSKHTYLHLKHTNLVNTEMKKIARLMSAPFAENYLREMSALSPDDAKKVTNPKMTALQAFELYLTGDMPEEYKPLVKTVLSNTNKNIHANRRQLAGAVSALASGTAWGVGRLFWNGQGWEKEHSIGGYAGATLNLGKDAVVGTSKVAYNNAGTIAGVTIATVLGGPLTGAAYWMATRMFSNGKVPDKK